MPFTSTPLHGTTCTGDWKRLPPGLLLRLPSPVPDASQAPGGTLPAPEEMPTPEGPPAPAAGALVVSNAVSNAATAGVGAIDVITRILGPSRCLRI
eukprot:scaffold3477_cov112-Isochrysis_galbana.AAC.3